MKTRNGLFPALEGRCGREKGFTLVELLIALFITSVVALAVYSVYNTFFRQSSIQDLKVEAQQNARVALNFIERELVNAGYHANTADVITQAESSLLEFIYTDPETDAAMSATAGQRLRVMYSLQSLGGVQFLVRKADNLTDGTTGSTEQVAQHVNSLTLTYYDMDGAEIAPSTQPERNNIRFVTVNLVTRTKSDIPGTGAPATFMLETHVRLRNMGVGQASNDTDAPSEPEGTQVRDPGLCGRLKVKWTKNSEGDVSGYKVYYGVASGSYEGVVNIPAGVLSGSAYSCSDTGTEIECTIFPSNPPLAHTPSDGSSVTSYNLAVKAYDNSLNHSDFSAEVSGNPGVSNSVFDSGTDDSTLNPVKPSPVAGFTGADGSSEGQVALSWTAYNTSLNPDVTGFRIYRSASSFTDYPVDPPSQPGIEWIAGEPGSGKPEVGSSATSYTDAGPGLVGCRVYHYAIAPVNCDTTLIPDGGGDPAEKKYTQADYGATCGDGVNACSAGTGFAAVAGSDTSPDESVSPGAPGLSLKAGWQRVAVSLTQPVDGDLSQTCVYVNENETFPELRTNTDWFPKVNGCYQVDGGQLIPDYGGIITASGLAPGASMSFWHDSMTEESPAVPSLLSAGTYYYKSVAFDICGNASDIAQGEASSELCGDEPAGRPDAVDNAAASCCAGPVTLSWDPVVTTPGGVPSNDLNPIDIAGFRIFRSTSADFSAATLISGAAPYWGSSFGDAAVTEGVTYYYRIVSTDCFYELLNPSEAAIRGAMLSGELKYAQVGPVTPGRLERDEKCAGGGSCTKDLHREVLTGVDMNDSSGSGTGASSPNAELRHHTVTMFFHNTSAGAMTVTGATVYWVNSSAYLRGIKIGGGRGGVGATSTSLSSGLTASGGASPYTRVVSNAALASAAIPAGARYVPITFTFKDSSDNPVDMREDQLLITLEVTSDSTGTAGCRSYMTVSLEPEGVFVPFGPSVTATQQDRPSSPTFGYAVPGSTGLNTVPSGSDAPVVVDSGVTVTVSASIAGNTTDAETGNKVVVSSATLYYRTTATTTTAPPDSGYTAAAMTNIGGNIWSAAIPASNGLRVWYYIVAADNDGNWDRDPEKLHGAYVYDQKDFQICDVTPSAPTGLTATPSGSDVALSWSAVTTYTNGSAVDATDSIRYRVFRDGAQINTDQAGLAYSDTGLSDGIYSYTVKAVNSCSPDPNVGGASNTAAACVGATGYAAMTVSPASIYRGASFTVNIVDCLAVNGVNSTTVETINSTAGFTGFSASSTAPDVLDVSDGLTIPETGAATGAFTKTIGTTADPAESGKLLTLATDTISVYYPYADPDTRTISVVVDPCTDTPKAPTGLGGSVQGQNMTLTWSAVTQNTDNSAITDLAGYRVYEKVCANGKPNCTGGDIVKNWFLRRTAGSGATSVTVDSDQGNVSQRIYYFRITAYDSCATPEESGYSTEWNE